MHLIYINKADKPFHHFPAHQHEYWEITLLVEGSGTMTVEGKAYPVSAGSVLIIPPRIPHGTQSEAGVRDFCAAFTDFIPIRGNRPLFLEDGEEHFLLSLMEMMLSDVQNTPENSKALMDALSNSFYQYLVSLSHRSSDSGDLLAGKLKSILAAHITDRGYSVGDAMAEMGYSKGYLRRVFSRSTGCSPAAWLNRQRIALAKGRMRQFPNLYTIRQVSQMSGFSDPYYFSRLFRQMENQSPSEFLTECRNQTQAAEATEDDMRSGIQGILEKGES